MPLLCWAVGGKCGETQDFPDHKISEHAVFRKLSGGTCHTTKKLI